MSEEVSQFTVLVVGHGLWGAGDSEAEALDNVPYSIHYMKEKGYTVLEFKQPISHIEVGPFGIRWQWEGEDDDTRTFEELVR